MTVGWAELVGALVVVLTAAALVAAGAVLLTTHRPVVALAVLLDLLLAAGLLRLAVPPTWTSLASAAAIVGLRKLISAGLRAGRRARGSGSPAAVG